MVTICLKTWRKAFTSLVITGHIQHTRQRNKHVSLSHALSALCASCSLLTQTAFAHLLAAVRPIISLPPFLCSSSSLGRAQRRGGEAGEAVERRGGFLSSDIVIKESPPLGWPAHSLTLTLSGSQTHSHSHTLLSAQPKERQAKKKDKEWDTQDCEVQLYSVTLESTSKVNLRQRKGVGAFYLR